MKTREEVIAMLENISDASTAVRTTDVNGVNENYGVCEISTLIDDEADRLTIHDYEYTQCEPATDDVVDLDVWAQEFDADNITALRNEMEQSNLYVARFHSDEHGQMDILIWG